MAGIAIGNGKVWENEEIQNVHVPKVGDGVKITPRRQMM